MTCQDMITRPDRGVGSGPFGMPLLCIIEVFVEAFPRRILGAFRGTFTGALSAAFPSIGEVDCRRISRCIVEYIDGAFTGAFPTLLSGLLCRLLMGH